MFVVKLCKSLMSQTVCRIGMIGDLFEGAEIV